MVSVADASIANKYDAYWSVMLICVDYLNRSAM